MKKDNKKYIKLMVFAIFFLLAFISAVQGVVQLNIINLKQSFISTDSIFLNDPESINPIVDPYFIWEDDFESMEFIDPDPSFSYDFELVDGTIQIKNTYDVWTDPSWTRMKPIEITNNLGQTLTNYAIHLTVDYDSDMQSGYEDIRFKHENSPSTWLDYWIETQDPISASVWVEIPVIPTGYSMLYLFYGNPSANDLSDFYSVFSDWDEEWANDEQITYHLDNEGAWDPDTCYGNDEFIVAWEEGQAYFPPYTWGFKQEIRASIYAPDGERLVFDELVYKDSSTFYRNENPSIAYGGGKWFVAWENYDTVANPSPTTMDIKARTVTRSGGSLQLGSVTTVCGATDCQADPMIVFDSVNNHFCVVWEDARISMTNYNIYARLYTTSGSPVSTEKIICSDANTQCEPWVSFDPINEQFLFVWEDGITPDNGPFSIKAALFDKNLNQVGSTMSIATGTDNTDYNFPCVSFSEETECYFITWNDCDISDGDWYGNVWGIILDSSGNVVVSTFQIRNGNFVRTDIIPYLSSSFLVAFDGGATIWGKLVSSGGDVFAGDVQLSASTAVDADWVNLASGSNKIFVVWEDARIAYPPPWNDMPDAFGNIWSLNIPSGSEVSCVIGTEKKLILTAQITSKIIQPDDLVTWHEFDVIFDGAVNFDILDSTGTIILISDAGPGEDLSGINPTQYPGIRLQAHFSRTNPSSSPYLDWWSITYVGIDDDPPQTTVREIVGTMGENNWYISNVKITLDATDGQFGTGVNHTYYQIDDEDPEEYDDAVGIKLPWDDPNEVYGIWDVWFWSEDKAGNIEDPQGPVNIKIDKASPHCEIWDPADRSNVPLGGGFWVQANATDIGSGVHYVSFDVGTPYENPADIYEDDPPGSGIYRWLCDRSYDKQQWKHIIAQVYDYAGHMYEYNIYVFFGSPEYQTGYVYIFGNPYGPFPLMSAFRYSIAIDQNYLPLIVTDLNEEASYVDIIAKQRFRGNEFTFKDEDLTDGCFCDLNLPVGIYSIIARQYGNGGLIDERTIVPKMIVILI